MYITALRLSILQNHPRETHLGNIYSHSEVVYLLISANANMPFLCKAFLSLLLYLFMPYQTSVLPNGIFVDDGVNEDAGMI
jgi:hypothetical protein